MTSSSPNGRLLDSELTGVQGVRLANRTANAFRRMEAACTAETGVTMWPALPDGGYRDLATQANIGAKNPESTVPIAAQGSSTHGWGTRVDVGSFGAKWGTDGAKRQAWLIANASRFGFFREFGAADPNHFAHDGFTATAPIITAASAGTITPIEEDDMPNYTNWSQADKDNLVKDIWQNFRYFKNYQGVPVAPIDIIRETERATNTVLLGAHNIEDKVNGVTTSVGALAADQNGNAATIAAALKAALPANLAEQVVAELGKQLQGS